MNLAMLAEPFPEKEIEWRVGQAGVTGAGKVWCKVLAYVTNRAIMQRLDDVCGPGAWRNEYRYQPFTTADAKNGEEKGLAILCGLSVLVGDQWVTKWDGAENTDIESVKGGLSNAMKRAAVQWGIGRYLYDLEEGWATIADDGDKKANYVPKNDKKSIPAFRWYPPKLDAKFLPSSGKARGGSQQPTGAPNVSGVASGVVSGVAAHGAAKSSQDRLADEDRPDARAVAALTGTVGLSPSAAASKASKSGEKKVPLAQKNVDMLMKKANGQIMAVQEIVARIIPGSAVTHEASTWPKMDADTYHAIVTAIETLDPPEAIQVDDLCTTLEGLLGDKSIDGALRADVSADYTEGKNSDELTIDGLRGLIARLAPLRNELE